MSSAMRPPFPALSPVSSGKLRWCLCCLLVLSLISSAQCLFYTDDNDLPRIGRRSGSNSPIWTDTLSKVPDSRLAELLERAVRGVNRLGYLDDGRESGEGGVERRGGVEWRPAVAAEAEGRVGRRGGVEWRPSGVMSSPGGRAGMRRDMPGDENMAAEKMAENMADKMAAWLSYRTGTAGGSRYRRHTTPHQQNTETTEERLNSEDGQLFDKRR